MCARFLHAAAQVREFAMGSENKQGNHLKTCAKLHLKSFKNELPAYAFQLEAIILQIPNLRCFSMQSKNIPVYEVRGISHRASLSDKSMTLIEFPLRFKSVSFSTRGGGGMGGTGLEALSDLGLRHRGEEKTTAVTG